MTITKKKGTLIDISAADLVQFTHYNGKRIERPSTDKLLFLAGFDVSKGYEITKCAHRTRISQQIVNCERYVGIERTDDNWKALKRSFV